MEKEKFLKIKVENILYEYFQQLPAKNKPRYTDWYFAAGGP